MSLQTWWTDLESAFLAKLVADADLSAACKLIEVGRFLPVIVEDIPYAKQPYIGCRMQRYGADLGKVPGSAVGWSTHDGAVVLNGLLTGVDRLAVEATAKQILSHLGILIGGMRIPTPGAQPFPIPGDRAQALDLIPGGGGPEPIATPEDQGRWRVVWSYEFIIRFRLRIR